MVSQNTTDWVVLERSDLGLVLALAKVNEADANVESGVTDPAPTDLQDPSTLRSTLVLAHYVGKFREAVRMASRYPLSVTPAAVPNDAMLHVLRLTAFELLSSTPTLAATVLTKELPTWQKHLDNGLAYLKAIREGGSVPVPQDPTGQDYLTAPSDTNPLPSLVQWSDLNATKADYARGYKVTPSGSTIQLPQDDMTTI